MNDSITGLASTKVLNTYELLEKILSHAGSTALFNAQQVCREWRTLARRSKTLRACLMLDTDGIETGHDCTWWVNAKMGLICETVLDLAAQTNPLLKLHVNAWRDCSVWSRDIKEEGLQDILSSYPGFWKYILNFRKTPYTVELQEFRPDLDVSTNGWTTIKRSNGDDIGSKLDGTIELLGYRNLEHESLEDGATTSSMLAISITVDVTCTIGKHIPDSQASSMVAQVGN